MPYASVYYAIISAVLFGLSTPFSKMLLESVDAWFLAGLLYLGAGLGLVLVNLLSNLFNSPKTERNLSRKDAPSLLLVTLFGGIFGPLFLLYGLQKSAASTTSLILNLEGVFTLLIAAFVFSEQIGRKIAFGALWIFFGVTILSCSGTSSQFYFSLGSLFVTIACLCWAIDNNVTRKLSEANPLQVAAFKACVAGTVNLFIAVQLGHKAPAATILIPAFFVGFFCYGLSLTLFVRSLRDLGAARTGAYFSTAPFAGAILSIVLLSETLSTQLIFGMIAMAVGVFLLLSDKHAHGHVHTSLSHDHRHEHDEHHQHEHGCEEAPNEVHSHIHTHKALEHSHPHCPDLHHRHGH